MALRKIGKYYYSYFRDEFGKIHTIATRCTEKEKAILFDRNIKKSLNAKRMKFQLLKYATPELLAKIKETETLAGKPPEEKTAHKRGTMALSAMFESACTKRNISGDIKSAWNHFCKNIGVKFADQVTSKMALDYLNTHYGKRKAKTWNNHKSMCNTIFRLTLVETGLSSSPFAAIMDKIVDDAATKRNLTDQEIDLIMKNSDIVIQIMTMLSRWTGQRLETCAKMTFAEFDFDKKVYLKKPGKTARFNKWVCVPLFPELEKFLLEIKGEIKNKEIPIIKNFPQLFTTNDYFSHKFIKLLKKLDITENEYGKASFHSLRGSFITWSKENNIPFDIRRDITGHSSLTTEDKYARQIKNVSAIAKSFHV